ncbi:MAG: DUF3179 domain-containing protein [Candidatus Paceibacterota bacterium]
MKVSYIVVIVLLLAAVAAAWYLQRADFPLPSGESVSVEETSDEDVESTFEQTASVGGGRDIRITDGTRHSIPLDEILSGGPGKDGIPSIDDPKFISPDEADFLVADDIGLGLTIEGESRFYPYKILVWHEIVNDTLAGEPVMVTYCPLCATGIVFERKVAGEVQEFGVSGRLWQSNLLMYNRADSEDEESLWSQVLGEAVVGPNTGERLPIIRSDIVQFGDWIERNPDTTVLSRDTGASRNYGRDPYGGYYSSDSVSFGAEFTDDRLHPKDLVHGVEIDGQFKAYHHDALAVGTTIDQFAGSEITITKSDIGEVSFSADGESLSSIPGFWFSWVAVHPESELYQ